MYESDGPKESLDSLLQRSTANTWKKSLSHELGRIVQGIDNIDGNNVVDYINKCEIPKDRIVTYANVIWYYRPNKSEPYRVRLTVVIDRLPYPDDAVSPAASLLETKLLLNSTILDVDQGARFMTMDITDFS